MNVFLTGSTGLLGINIIHVLLAHGHEVLALVRNPEKAKQVLPDDPRITVIPGDIESPQEWLPRLQEADALIHGAAYFREFFGPGDHEARLRKLNIEFPVQLTAEANRYGLKKAVMISSSSVIAPRPDGSPATEEDPPCAPEPENRYSVSKQEMEEALAKIAPISQCPIIIIRPGWMFGPYDYAPTAAGGLVKELVEKRSAQMAAGTPLGIADVRDVAEGTVRALEKCDRSETFNLTGNMLSADEALKMIAQQIPGAKAQIMPLPMAFMVSRVLEVVSGILNKPNPIPRVGLLAIGKGVPVSAEKAKRELGVSFRPFAETAKDTVSFFQNQYPRFVASR
ncbi:MAG: SDR family oxidoreductase [Armatimonadaceae bacterium]